MRLLPNMSVYCPADWVTATALVDQTRKTNCPKYLRFDGKALPALYDNPASLNMEKGFAQLADGKRTCLVSTGFMSHRAMKVAQQYSGIAVIDIFCLKPCNEAALAEELSQYDYIITMEEAFINNGGLDSLISKVVRENSLKCAIHPVGVNDRYIFDLGSRDRLHAINGMDEATVIALLDRLGR